jgi:hypothetical protein
VAFQADVVASVVLGVLGEAAIGEHVVNRAVDVRAGDAWPGLLSV